MFGQRGNARPAYGRGLCRSMLFPGRCKSDTVREVGRLVKVQWSLGRSPHRVGAMCVGAGDVAATWRFPSGASALRPRDRCSRRGGKRGCSRSRAELAAFIGDPVTSVGDPVGSSAVSSTGQDRGSRSQGPFDVVYPGVGREQRWWWRPVVSLGRNPSVGADPAVIRGRERRMQRIATACRGGCSQGRPRR